MDFAHLIGIRYKEGGADLNGFNCWGLLRYVLAQHFNKQLPAITLGDADGIRYAHSDAMQRGIYSPVGIPQHGDPVLLRGGDNPHVGIYLDIDGGGVLHSIDPYGVTWTKMRNLRTLGFSRYQFYRVN